MTLDKPIEELVEGDLLELVENQVRERRRLEFKSELPARNDDGMRSFLAEVSSFANTDGGHLIYGIEERDGVAIRVAGLDPETEIDATTLRLENAIRDNIRPSLRVQTGPVSIAHDRQALVLRIARSHARPHVVDRAGHWKFYRRSSAGKYPIEDVSELRDEFIGSEAVHERLRRFRQERLDKLDGGDPCIVLHVLPIVQAAIDQQLLHDIRADPASYVQLATLRGPTEIRFNFDGLIAKLSTANSYFQLFRTGMIEVVDATLFGRDGGWIPSKTLEEGVIEALARALALCQRLNAPPPSYVCLSLLNVRGLQLAGPGSMAGWQSFGGADSALDELEGRPMAFEQRNLVVPEIMIESSEPDVAAAMRSVFDILWNAAGLPCSPYYNPDGTRQ